MTIRELTKVAYWLGTDVDGSSFSYLPPAGLTSLREGRTGNGMSRKRGAHRSRNHDEEEEDDEEN